MEFILKVLVLLFPEQEGLKMRLLFTISKNRCSYRMPLKRQNLIGIRFIHNHKRFVLQLN